MLSIRVDKNSSYQAQIAAISAESLPNRLKAAQSAALEKAKQQLKIQLPTLGRPAKYILINIEGFGPVGATLRLTPQKSYRSSKVGYDRGMAAYVFIKGRRGGRVVKAKSGNAMKVRQKSVAEGYPPFLKEFKLGPLRPNKDAVLKMAREVVLESVKLGLRAQGFGTRGGTPRRIATDIPFPQG